LFLKISRPIERCLNRTDPWHDRLEQRVLPALQDGRPLRSAGDQVAKEVAHALAIST
jgi:hypothetical protein